MAAGDNPKAKRVGPTLRDLVEEMNPEIVEDLMAIAKVKTQAELAKVLNANETTLSRYKTKKQAPTETVVGYYMALGFTRNQAAWRIGHLLQEKYSDGRPDRQAQPGEVREPSPRYDERNLERALAKVDAYDFGVLEPEEMIELNKDRNALRASCTEVERLRDAHLELVDRFVRRAERKIARVR